MIRGSNLRHLTFIMEVSHTLGTGLHKNTRATHRDQGRVCSDISLLPSSTPVLPTTHRSPWRVPVRPALTGLHLGASGQLPADRCRRALGAMKDRGDQFPLGISNLMLVFGCPYLRIHITLGTGDVDPIPRSPAPVVDQLLGFQHLDDLLAPTFVGFSKRKFGFEKIRPPSVGGQFSREILIG